MGLSLVTPAATYPITLAEAKAQCRVDSADEEALIAVYIAAATDYVEKYTGLAIVAQTWDLKLDAFSDAILLPLGPVSSVSSVKYYDTSDVEQTLSSTVYTADLTSDPQWIVRNSTSSWPVTADGVNVVTIRFVAGFAAVPAAIKQAILLLVGQWFANRENAGQSMQEMPHAVEALLANQRRYSF